MKIINFIRKTSKPDQNICFRLRDGRKVDLHHKSEIIINVADWDMKNSRLKKPSGNVADETKKRLVKLNDKIDEREKLIRDIYLEQTNTDGLTSDWLDAEIDKKLNPEKYEVVMETAPAEITLLAHLEDFISKAPGKKIKETNRLITESTIKSYKANQSRLIAFLKHKRREKLLLSEINEKFYTDYVDFLTNRKRTIKRVRGVEVNEVRQYANNTIGEAIKALKTMIADVKGLNIDVSEFYVLKEEVDNVYLNEEELRKLQDLDLSERPFLDRVRDWFLLLAWTGSRFSDIEKIDPANIKNNMITYRQQKTNKKVVIPVHNVVEEILQKYNYQMPEIISNQKFNDYIKQVCRLAGIDGMESLTRTVGGRLVTETRPKYDLVSSHTCRRSFCTNMYRRGLDTLMIRSISGHKTDKSFLKYIKVTEEEHAEMMAKKWSEIYK